MVLYGIGALSRGFYFLFGRQVGVSSVYNLVDYFFTFAPWALLLFLIEYFSDKGTLGKSLFLWGGFLPSEIVFTFLRPGRAYLLSIIFGCLIIYHYLKRRIRVLLIAAVFVLIIVLFFPAISAVKPLAWEGLSPKFSTFSTDIDLMQKEISLKFQDTTFWGYFENAYHEIMNRIHGIDSFTTIIAYTPASIEYQYGRTIIATLGFLLPQFIREKTFLKNLDEDILSLGRRMGCIYYGTEQEIAGIIIMQIAELYLNFSLYGVIIGMFMLGVFYRVFYLYFIVKNPHRFSLFIYTILCFWVVMPEYWFIHAYENFIKQLLMLFAIVWCLNGGRVFKGSPRTFVRRG
jgi:hypothetical protein